MNVSDWIAEVASSTCSTRPSRHALPLPLQVDTPLAPVRPKRKRAAVPVSTRPRKSQRLALYETSANIAPSKSPPKPARFMPQPHAQTGISLLHAPHLQSRNTPKMQSRGRRQQQQRQHQHPQQQQNKQGQEQYPDLDYDATPRAGKRTRLPPPSGLERPTVDDAAEPRTVRRSSLSQSSASKESASTTSRRSSPAKKPTSLQNLPQRIHQQVPRDEEVADAGVLGLSELWEQMHNVADGLGVVPVATFNAISGLDSAFKSLHREVFDHTDKRAALGSIPDVDYIAKITELTNDCIADTANEHGWNSFVQGPILTEAIWRSSHRRRTAVKDVSTCAIQPALLLPQDSDAYKVDYAIVLRPDARFYPLLQQLDPLEGADPSFNATADPALACSPTCIGIEAKPAGEGGNKGGLQLSVWACATLNRLRRLQEQFGRPQTPMAELPLVFIQGETWKFRVALMDEEGVVTVWHHPKDLGSTTNAKGIFQVVMALQILAEWMELKWRPWFTQKILPV